MNYNEKPLADLNLKSWIFEFEDYRDKELTRINPRIEILETVNPAIRDLGKFLKRVFIGITLFQILLISSFISSWAYFNSRIQNLEKELEKTKQKQHEEKSKESIIDIKGKNGTTLRISSRGS